MAATGFAWLLAASGFSDLPLVFTVGQVFGALFFAVVMHLLLAFPTGQAPVGRRAAHRDDRLPRDDGRRAAALAVRRPEAARLRRLPRQRAADRRQRVARQDARDDPQRHRRPADRRGAGRARAALAPRDPGPAALPRARLLRGRGGAVPADPAGRAPGGRPQPRRARRDLGDLDGPVRARAVPVPRDARAGAHDPERRRRRADGAAGRDAAARRAARRPRRGARRPLARARLLAARGPALRGRARPPGRAARAAARAAP